MALLLGGAVALGIGAGYWLAPGGSPASTKPDQPIEWNAVQAVPTRALSPDEIAWEKRGRDTPVIASPEGARQSSERDVANEEGGLPRGDTARNDDGAAVPSGKLYVIDGDTFGIDRGPRIRILGIDAPETHPSRCAEEARLGNEATQKLRELLASSPVTLSGSGYDKYGRELRSVSVNGQDVGDAMIGAGLARSYDGGKRGGWCG